MYGSESLRQLTERMIAHSPAEQTEVSVVADEAQLTRFANNEIHQHVKERNARVNIRVVVGRRVGVASGNDLAAERLEEVLQRALSIARLQPERSDFPGLPGPQPVGAVEAWSEATASCTPEQRAAGVAMICRRAEELGLVASGAFTTSAREVAVANSLGTWAYHPSTTAQLSAVMMSDSSSGYAEHTSLNVNDIDPMAVGDDAIDKALRGRSPMALEPGDYPVVLEEYAVATLVRFLGLLGLGALEVQEGRSFLEPGVQQAGAQVNLWDDGHNPALLPMPFDYEGQPRKRVDFFTDGVSKGVVYDSLTAARAQVENTGHALPAPNTFGPRPQHLILGSGATPREELARGIKRGIWITRFWYVRPVNSKRTILTGMTRDGTFLIEDGEVSQPINNLRFTQSALAALADVETIADSSRLLSDAFACALVPALRIGSFSFTSATEF